MPTHLSLFSGIGGIDLAAEWAGFETIAFVEIDKFCQKVLKKHWPNVPILEDIHDVTREKIEEIMADSQNREQPQQSQRNHWEEHPRQTQERCEFRAGSGVGRGDIAEGIGELGGSSPSVPDVTKEKVMAYAALEVGQTHEIQAGRQTTAVCLGESRRSGDSHSPITLITGGFPCQPVSVAGKRRGKEDDRWLWPQMLRIISEVRPTWVVAENVAGLARMGLDDCLADLEGEGFEVTTFLIPACGVNAPHRRNRIFIVAYDGLRKSVELSKGKQKCGNGIGNGGEDVAHASVRSQQRSSSQCDVGGLQDSVLREGWNPDHWAVEPNVGRVASGIPSRVDRLRALGNSVVPQQIYPILKAIADIEVQSASINQRLIVRKVAEKWPTSRQIN